MIRRILILLTSFVLILGQEIPNEFYQFQSAKLLLDAGENWESNTTFGPLRFNHGNNITDSLKVQTRFGSYMLAQMLLPCTGLDISHSNLISMVIYIHASLINRIHLNDIPECQEILRRQDFQRVKQIFQESAMRIIG